MIVTQNGSDYNNVIWDSGLPRSYLYPLKPIGLDTPYIESFTSYITRLAYLYQVRPRTLILQEILPLLKISGILKPDNCLSWLKGSTGLNGMTPLVAEWVQAVEDLTLYSGLKFSTMLTWCNVVDQSGIVRQKRAWCPHCYNEWLHAGKEIYDPLIWAIRVIDKCHLHMCNLLHQCPHEDCRKSLPLLDSWSKPGYCPNCSRFLGVSNILKNGEENKENHEWNEWVNNEVGKLIAFAPSMRTSPRKEVVASCITLFMEQAMGGSFEAFARSLGVSGIKLRGWQKGLHIPQFDMFLRLCWYMKISPLDFLNQKIDAIEFMATVHVAVGNRNFVGDKELQQYLEALLNKDKGPFPSLKDVARELKYSVQVLQHKFPQLCQNVSQKYQKQLDPVYQKNFLERVLVDEDLKRCSLNEISTLLGCRVTLIKYRFPDLCRQIVRNRERKADLENIQKALNEIIASTQSPPPSVKEVLVELKCSNTTLYRHFSDACHTIAKKHQEWLVTQQPVKHKPLVAGDKFEQPLTAQKVNAQLYKSNELTDRSKPLLKVKARKQPNPVNIDTLEHALMLVLASDEEPFPTVVEAARRLNFSSSTLYQRFPNLCHDITNRAHGFVDLNDIRRQLEEVIVSHKFPFPSLLEISRQINYSESSLRCNFPDLSQKIVHLHKYSNSNDDQTIKMYFANINQKENEEVSSQKKQINLDSLQMQLEKVLNNQNCPSMIEVADLLGYPTPSLYHHFPQLCREIARQHKQQKKDEINDLNRALEDVLLSDQMPLPTMQEVAVMLGCSDKVLYHHFPELCHAIANRHRHDLAYLQNYLEDVLVNPEPPSSMKQIARKLGYSVAILTNYFPEQCKAIKERFQDSKGFNEQRALLESVANAEQIFVSVNEIARSLGCSNSVLSNRFPELCRVITERRWKLSDREELRLALDAALLEEPPPTLQEVAMRLDCPAKNIEYYFPDLCKAVAERHRLAVNIAGQQRALEALLNIEVPVSFQEATRRLGVKSTSLREKFPELSFLISERYKDYRRKNSEARVKKLCDEVRQAAFLLHSQGIRPDTTQIGFITGKPVKFRLPEVREAFRSVMNDLGYEI